MLSSDTITEGDADFVISVLVVTFFLLSKVSYHINIFMLTIITNSLQNFNKNFFSIKCYSVLQ